MSEEQLKPCPFCGKEPYVGKAGHAGCANGNTYMVGKRLYNICPIAGDAMTKEQWNSRPTEDALRKRVQELEAALCSARAFICKGKDRTAPTTYNQLTAYTPARVIATDSAEKKAGE